MKDISKFLGLKKSVVFWNSIYVVLFFSLLLISQELFTGVLVLKSIFVFLLVFMDLDEFEKKTMIFPAMHLNMSSLVMGILYGAVLLGFWIYENFIIHIVGIVEEFNKKLNS